MPNRQAVFELTRRWTGEYFRTDPSAIDEHAPLMEIEGADSVKMIRLLGAVERHFGIKMMVEDLDIAQTLQELVEQIIAVKSRELQQNSPQRAN
ncbi:acyl carrier protein [Mycolicibacterium setense]